MSKAQVAVNANNVFTGEEALLDYLNPGKQLPTPLIELPRRLNQFAGSGVRILAKAAFLNPLLTIKLNAARGILDAAKAAGLLEGIQILVENSSGGMGFALAILARYFDIPNVVVTLPLDIPESKQSGLQLLGADCRKMQGGIKKSAEMGKQPGWFNSAQYHNPANPAASEAWVGAEIWKQTEGDVSVLSAGMGTGGTIVGVSKYLRARSTNITILGVTPVPDQVPGTRSLERLKEVGHDWENAIDRYLGVSVKESYKASLQLCREGILGGPSSGLAYAGLLQFLRGRNPKDLDLFRNKDGEVVAVFICPDTFLPYLDKYTTHLDAADLAKPE